MPDDIHVSTRLRAISKISQGITSEITGEVTSVVPSDNLAVTCRFQAGAAGAFRRRGWS